MVSKMLIESVGEAVILVVDAAVYEAVEKS